MACAPTLQTHRLRLVSFSEEYCTDRYIAWLNDPDVVKYSEQRHKRHTYASCRAYYQSFMNSECPHYFWAILLNAPSLVQKGIVHIGTLTAYFDPPNSTADIGILIGEKSAWQQGCGLEAWNAVLDYLLNTMGLRKVTAGTIAPNSPMLSVMCKSGMQLDGRRSRQILWGNTEVDVIYMASFRNSCSSSDVIV